MAATTLQSFPSSDVKMRFAETYVSEGLNAKLAGVIPRGIYRGFNLVPNLAPLTAQLDPDSLGRHLAVYESLLGFSLTLRRSGGIISVPLAAFAGTTVYVVLFAEYTISSPTVAELRVYSVADYNSAPEKNELIVLGVVTVPGFGAIPPSAISYAKRTLLQDTNQGWDTPRVFGKIDQDFGQDAFGASGVATTADQDTIPHDYKLLHAYKTSQASDVQVRCYSRVGGGGRFAITVNARWGGGASQTWTADDVAQPASKSSFTIGGAEIVGRLVTAAPWADAGWSFGESALSTKVQVDTVAPSGQLLLLQQFKYTTAPDVYARIYSSNVSSGEMKRGLVITINARFNTGTLLWVADDIAIPAGAAALSNGATLAWLYRPVTAVPWAVGDWTPQRASHAASAAFNLELVNPGALPAPSPLGGFDDEISEFAAGVLLSPPFPFTFSPLNENWYACTSGALNGGVGGRILRSTNDGKNWVDVGGTLANDHGYFAIATDGIGTFVAVGGETQVGGFVGDIRSFFGAPITPRIPGAPIILSQIFRGVAFGGGIWVVVGDRGQIQTSPDTVTWTARVNPLPPLSVLLSVTYGNGVFVIVGTDALSAPIILSSPDGINWTLRANPVTAPATVFFHSSVAFGGNEFVISSYAATAGDQHGIISSSPDGINWTRRADIFSTALAPDQRNGICRKIVYHSGLSAFVGMSSTTNRVKARIHASLNGLDQPWGSAFAVGDPIYVNGEVSTVSGAVGTNGKRVMLGGPFWVISRTPNSDYT